MKRTSAFWITTGAALAAAALASSAVAETECSRAGDATARIAPLARGDLATLVVLKSPRPVATLPFSGPDGRPEGLDALKGKLLLINLWATWCVPCREEMPSLDKLQAQFGGPDFEVVAINLDTRNPDRARKWLEQNGVTRLAFRADPEGRSMQALQRTGDLVGLPTTLLVDGSGCQLAVMKGPADWGGGDAQSLIAAALARELRGPDGLRP